MIKNSTVSWETSSNNVNKAKYIDQIKYLKNTYIDSSIRLHIIDDDTNIETLSVEGFNTNISQYIESNIPKHLDNKYEIIKNKLKDA